MITLGVSLSGLANGSEVITVSVVENSIYDANGRVASTSQSNNTATLKDHIVPATPSGLVATPGNSKVVLSWTANNESDLASYKIYRGTSANPTTVLVTLSGSTTLTNTGRTNGTTYYYRISAVDNAGNESVKSSEASSMPSKSMVTVKKDGSGDYNTIQSAINGSNNGDTIVVYAGTYQENINYNGKNIVVQGEDRETTIIDGNQSGSVVTFENGEDTTAVLSGFTITNGSGRDQNPTTYGGGIYCPWGGPTISNNIISGNSADYGGGIYLSDEKKPRLVNLIIENNGSGETIGGGIYAGNANAEIDKIINKLSQLLLFGI